MTRPQFQDAARRVSLYGNLLIWVTGSVVIILASLLAWMIEPTIRGFGTWVRGHLQSEVAVGLVGGLVCGVVIAPLLLIPLVPALWVDRRFGLRCPNCRRSVTLRCHHYEVLQTGKCCLCHQFLFETNGSENAVEPSAEAVRAHY